MNVILDSPWVERIGWALLHSLWQGALIWSLAAIVFAVDRKLSAARRHWMGWLAITLLAFCPLVTITWLACKAAPQKTEAAAAASASVIVESQPRDGEPRKPVSVSLPISLEKVVQEYDRAANAPPSFSLRPLFPFLVIGWLVGVVMLTVRLALGWWWLSRLRHRSAPVAGPWTETFANLRRRFSLPASMIRSADHLGIPMVVGWLRPVIYLPASLLSGQSAAEVEAVFLHEMAHLKRHDLLLQLWVTIVETLLFYHPAVHALGRITRETAEEACDDLVLQWTSDGRSYARALVALEESRGERLALAATGGRLRHRVRRILGMPQEVTRPGLGLRFGFTACVGVALYFFLVGVAVPQLAKALTPAERVALIEKKQEEGHVALQTGEPKEFVAVGQVHLPPGAEAPASYQICTFAPNYTTFASTSKLKNVRADGHGDQMTVGVLMDGFAPAETPTIYRDPKAKRATFDLTVEKGFPALIQVLDEQGKPVGGATLSINLMLPSGGSISPNGPKKVTDDAGILAAHHVASSTRIDCLVFAHGFQWRQFRGLMFAEGKPTVLHLVKAEPIIGEVVDAATQRPVPGCYVKCYAWNSPRSSWIWSWGGEGQPVMSAQPSDAAGHVILDGCHPEDNYEALFDVPGYRREIVKIEKGMHSFHAELKKGLVLEGVIRDPDKLLKASDGKVSCYLSVPKSGSDFRSLKFPLDAEGLHVRMDQLAPGEFSFSCGAEPAVKIKMDRDLTGVEWRVTKEGLVRLDGTPIAPESPETPEPRRQVRVHFIAPTGAPPVNGQVAFTVSHHGEGKRQEGNVTDGMALVDVGVPGYLHVRPGALPGWTFNEKNMKIEVGDTPVELEVEMVPAGAISGTFLNAPPNGPRLGVTGSLMIIGERVMMPDRQPWHNDDGYGGLRHLDGGRYFIPCLPLHGSYRVAGRKGVSFAETPVLTLDEAHPFLNQDVTFVKGVNLSGRLLQPDGKPCSATNIRFLYQSAQGSLMETVYSGLDGRFELPGVNFDVSGHYSLFVDASTGVAPLSVPLTKDMHDIKLQRLAGLPLDVVLLDVSDRPFPGVRLSAYPMSGQPDLSADDRVTSDAPSDKEGRTHFSTLKPGKYMISVDGGGHTLLHHELSAGDWPLAQLPMTSGESLRFRVKTP